MLRTSQTRTSIVGAIGVLATVLSLAGCGQSPTDAPARPANATSAGGGSGTALASNKPTTSAYEIKSFGLDVVSGNTGVVEVLCSAGKRALGGGFHLLGGALIADADPVVYESSPRVTSGADGWRLEASNRSAVTRTFEVWVICSTV